MLSDVAIRAVGRKNVRKQSELTQWLLSSRVLILCLLGVLSTARQRTAARITAGTSVTFFL